MIPPVMISELTDAHILSDHYRFFKTVEIAHAAGGRQQHVSFAKDNEQPTYFTTLSLYWKTLLQCMVVDEATGDIFATQVDHHLNSGEVQSFRIVRLNKNGEMLDWMACKYGGHGTTLGIENENGKVYIWSGYQDEQHHYKLVRVPYQPGVIIDGSEATTYNSFTPYYMTPITDQKNQRIAFRITDPEGRQVIELRRLEDVKKGVNHVLGRLQIPRQYTQTMQGVTIDGESLYWYTGDSNVDGISVPWRIIRFNMRTGKVDGVLKCDFGREGDGTWRDGFREPESLYLYTDPHTGQKKLLAGVVVGKPLKRVNKIYQLPLSAFKSS
ncbi:hypothetical protein GCM10011391_33020 [Pullulanibacillus camelliae]|uniref:P68 RBP/TagC-like beta-propeller domain-containing protein n=1 Tax=Pullulanibacillus camelliae TaxID=1707096 RepID=A0A8J2YLT0_9BACL|nr:hypothetical protein [Pullulanibacillus camelliae]GGE51624.1 hypothetical protein GCM10011391_33020 [Pullulanibacillus camelliae]